LKTKTSIWNSYLSSVNLKMQCNENPSAVDIEDDHEDLFEELNAL
jgi:hypothetical protein